MDQTESVPAPLPSESLAMLRKKHLAFMREEQYRSGPAAPEDRERLRDFLARVEAAGAIIDDHADRDAAQSILDYWTATLATVSEPIRPAARVLAQFDHRRAPDLRDRPSPFMGLHAFGLEDTDRYFGRAEAVRILLGKIARERLLIVSGPSGSGKSSLILAGLIPGLKSGAVPGSEDWRYLPAIVPGNDPLAALLVAIAPEDREQRTWVATHKPEFEQSASTVLSLVESQDPGPILLVVDQFEELFTLCQEEAVRHRFAEALVRLSHSTRAAHRIVLTIREGFLSDAFRLGPLVRYRDNANIRFTPGALSPRELSEVIERPAALVGLKFDEGVVDELIREVQGESTALPLLQFTLRKLWEHRDRNRITWDVYRKVGRPRDALKGTADAAFNELIPENQGTAKRIFGELVVPSVGAEFVRRRMRREALVKLEAPERVNHVLQHFVKAGLLRMTPGIEFDDDRFEVVHEALIRNWPRLDQWLSDRREQAKRELQFLQILRLWRQSGWNRGYLLTGQALKDASQYVVSSPELAELVAASRTAELRGRSMRTIAGVILLVFSTIGWVYEYNARQNATRDLNLVLAEKRRAEQATEKAHAAMAAQVQAEQERAKKAADFAETLSAFANAKAGRSANPKAVSQAIERLITDSISGEPNFWPTGSTLRVRFLNGSQALKSLIMEHAAEWTKYANINLQLSSAPDAEIRIGLNEPVTWSYLGIQARSVPLESPTMSLGGIELMDAAMKRHAILHEFGHALGLVHEPQQPGADIPWNLDAVTRDLQKRDGWDRETVQRNVLHKYSKSIGYSRPFDGASVMNYMSFPPDWTRTKIVVTLGPELSESDKALISRLYPGRWTPPGATAGAGT
jgi:hypothetical protein